MIQTITAQAAQALASQGMVQLVDATWQVGGTRPARGFLSGTTSSVDTKALKTLPPGERVGGAPGVFAQSGIGHDTPVCVYDRAGFFSAPWVAWLLASHGHAVTLVSGNGEEADFPGASPVEPFSSGDALRWHADKYDVLAALGSDTQIIDARSPGRFLGHEKEPRQGCRAGHIPGSLNLHYRNVVADGYYIDVEDIAEVATRAGVDLARPIITTCGSGVTASLVAVALSRIGAEDVRVYQGSWAEWGMDDSLPIEISA